MAGWILNLIAGSPEYELRLVLEVQRDPLHPEGVRLRRAVDVEHDEVDLKVGRARVREAADGLGRVDAEVGGRLPVARAEVVLAPLLRRRRAVAGAADAVAGEGGELRDEVRVVARRRRSEE